MIFCLVHIIGLIFGTIGMILTWIVTIMPYWRLVVLAENNGLVIEGGRIDGEWISRWDGLWLTCLKQLRLNMECNDYGSMVSLTADLKAARILMSFAVALSVIAFIFSLIGFIVSQCCRCCDDRDSENHCLTLTAGLMYFLSAILVIIPVVWTTVNISRRAYDAAFTKGAVRIEIGQALLLAWPNIAFLLIGGTILTFLCCFCSISTCCTREPCKQAVYKEHPVKEERSNCSPRMEYL
ncbi:claudin-8-like [Bufo bufo]|uniref:claudin-8-like n=1 Tax=Bufo bufo TaxID=8384 RepID=UPI001ABE1107|nr:claudin-8-like [Bufo bufo]